MKRSLAIEWLKAAQSDIILIEKIIDHPYLSHMVAFHSQQCIEKSFKGLLDAMNEYVPKKHDLLMLKDLVSHLIKIEYEDIFEDLNTLYIDSRYPSELGLLPQGKPTLEEARVFYQAAKEVFSKICITLGIEAQEIA